MAESLGGLAGSVQGTLTNTFSSVLNKGQSFIDRFFPPERRAELWAKFQKFATEKPLLASFILSQIALSGIPLSLFFVMTITVFVFALLIALVVALLGALLFTVFAVGFALIILLPTLLITTFTACFVWLWAVGAYYLVKWFNQKDVPGVNADGDLKQQLLGGAKEGEKPAWEDDAGGRQGQHAPPKLEKRSGGRDDKMEHSGSPGPKKPLNDVTKHVPAGDTVGDVTKNVPAGDKVGDVTDGVTNGGAGGVVNGVKKKADVGNVGNTVGGVPGVGGVAGKVTG